MRLTAYIHIAHLLQAGHVVTNREMGTADHV